MEEIEDEIHDEMEEKPIAPPSFEGGGGGDGGDDSVMGESFDALAASTSSGRAQPLTSLTLGGGDAASELLSGAPRPPLNASPGPYSGSDEDDDDDDDDDDDMAVEGAYNPEEYDALNVSGEIREIFQYITRYTSQTVELETKIKPFIPDFIPAVGDIDAFIKVLRPDTDDDKIGLVVLDEPCAKQSDPTVLELQLRDVMKTPIQKEMQIKSIAYSDLNGKTVDNWIHSISNLHRDKPPPTVHYNRTMPDIDTLMQEWPAEYEEFLKMIMLPSADIDCSVEEYVDTVCALLDIPVYKSRVQSLHVLFTLYSEFKNSQHFRSLAHEHQLDNTLKVEEQKDDEEDKTDQLIL